MCVIAPENVQIFQEFRLYFNLLRYHYQASIFSLSRHQSMIFTKRNYYIIGKSAVLLASTLTLFGLSANVLANEKNALNIQSVTFTKDTKAVNGKVRLECKLIEKTKKYLVAYGKKHFEPVTTESKAVAGAYNISAVIVGTVGAPGGALSGRKGATIKGTVTKNGKKVGSFEAFRSSGGGFGFGYKGTCSLLGKSVKRLGRDIAEWARSPAPGAKLGELK